MVNGVKTIDYMDILDAYKSSSSDEIFDKTILTLIQ